MLYPHCVPISQKFLQVADSLLLESGGPTSIIVQIENAIGHEFELNEVLVYGCSNIPELDKHFRIYGSRKWNRFGIPPIKSLVPLRECIRNSNIVLIHGFYLFSTLHALACSTGDTKIFLLPHGSLTKAQKRRRFLKFLFRFVFSRMVKKKSFCFVSASSQESSGIRDFFESMTVSRLDYGLHIPQEYTVSRVLPRQSPFTILSFSRIVPDKNIELILESLSILKNQRKDFKLVIAGAGKDSYIESLKRLSSALKISDSVEFCGSVPYHLKYPFIATTDCLILASKYESFGNVILEAMGMCKPCVVGPGVGARDLVYSFESGIIFTYYEPESIAFAIGEIIDRYPEYQRNCKPLLQSRGWKTISKQWVNEFTKSGN